MLKRKIHPKIFFLNFVWDLLQIKSIRHLSNNVTTTNLLSLVTLCKPQAYPAVPEMRQAQSAQWASYCHPTCKYALTHTFRFKVYKLASCLSGRCLGVHSLLLANPKWRKSAHMIQRRGNTTNLKPSPLASKWYLGGMQGGPGPTTSPPR